MTLRPSPWLYDFLKRYERLRPTAYAATNDERRRGIWTVGYGHTAGVKEGDTCTLAQAEQLLAEDVVQRAEAPISVHVKVPLNQNQYDALVSLVFNCGPAPLLETLGHKLNGGDYAGAAAEFIRWDKQSGVELDGLENRRIAERKRFETPVAEVVAA